MTTASGFLDIAKGTAILAGLGVGAYILLKGLPAAKEAAQKVANAFNPASGDNLAAEATNTIAEVVSGEQDVTVGTFLGDLADWLKGNSNIDEIDRREAAKGGTR